MAAHGASIAILAGAGALPCELADRLAARGCAARILAINGFADRATRRRAECAFDIVDARGIIGRLHDWAPDATVLAGMVHRPSPRAALSSVAAAYRNRDYLARFMKTGDDSLLRAVVSLLEGEGVKVVGIDQLAPELLAGVGVLGAISPSADAQGAVQLGVRCLAALSPFDVGQAVAVATSRIAAVEGPEGTDAMIRRVRKLWGSARLYAESRGTVLVKLPKRGQDLRVDLPAIGPRTIKIAAAAGFSGIAIATGRTLIIERAETIAEADRRGLFLVGLDEWEMP